MSDKLVTTYLSSPKAHATDYMLYGTCEACTVWHPVDASALLFFPLPVKIYLQKADTADAHTDVELML